MGQAKVNKETGDADLTTDQKTLSRLLTLPGLEEVEKRLQELSTGFDDYTPLFAKVVTGGGKRLRPALVLLCGSFTSAPPAVLVDVACAVELIHAASLVHDDVIDHAQLRRGLPTVSAQGGDHQAVLYGDFLFARAFSLLTKPQTAQILESMTKAISLMCEGEIEMANLLYNCDFTEADYYDYIYKKTAFFLSACCLAGTQAGKASQTVCNALAAFGLHLGYAFQLKDDLLDFTGKAEITGKPALQDLREGYLTLPVIKLLQHPLYSTYTKKIITDRNFTVQNLRFIRQSLDESGIVTELENDVRNFTAKAKQYLNLLPKKPGRIILARLADYIAQRKH